jgi:hypothetical protein
LTGITDLVTKGIDIALFCLFGSLVWENLGSRLDDNTERDRARKNIRAIAKFFLYSLVILMGAYLTDFARDQAWITEHFPTNPLMAFEVFMLFGGYVMFAPPLYAIGKVLRDPSKTISDATLPEVSQLLARSILALLELILIWSLFVFGLNDLFLDAFAISLVISLVGIVLTFLKLQGWTKRMLPWLLSAPLIVIVCIAVLVIIALILRLLI